MGGPASFLIGVSKGLAVMSSIKILTRTWQMVIVNVPVLCSLPALNFCSKRTFFLFTWKGSKQKTQPPRKQSLQNKEYLPDKNHNISGVFQLSRQEVKRKKNKKPKNLKKTKMSSVCFFLQFYCKSLLTFSLVFRLICGKTRGESIHL